MTLPAQRGIGFRTPPPLFLCPVFTLLPMLPSLSAQLAVGALHCRPDRADAFRHVRGEEQASFCPRSSAFLLRDFAATLNPPPLPPCAEHYGSECVGVRLPRPHLLHYLCRGLPSRSGQLHALRSVWYRCESVSGGAPGVGGGVVSIPRVWDLPSESGQLHAVFCDQSRREPVPRSRVKEREGGLRVKIQATEHDWSAGNIILPPRSYHSAPPTTTWPVIHVFVLIITPTLTHMYRQHASGRVQRSY